MATAWCEDGTTNATAAIAKTSRRITRPPRRSAPLHRPPPKRARGPDIPGRIPPADTSRPHRRSTGRRRCRWSEASPRSRSLLLANRGRPRTSCSSESLHLRKRAPGLPAGLPPGHAGNASEGGAHHLAHHLELFDDVGNVLRLGSGAICDALPARTVDELRLGAFGRRHRLNDRFRPPERFFVDLVFGDLPDAGKVGHHPDDALERTHLLDHPQLLEKVRQVKGRVAHLSLERVRVLGLDERFGALD